MINIGDIYESKFCGKYKIIGTERKHNRLYYKIQFLQTNYITSIRNDMISTGYIYDPYYPKVCGVGYMGLLEDGSSPDNSMSDRWRGMIRRCYCETDQAYPLYGGIGVRVCERWHCYANFLVDCKSLPGYNDMIKDPKNYNIDKDILQSNIPHSQRIYSPQTCMFVPVYMNSVQVAIDNFDKHSNMYYNVINHKNAYNVEIQINGVTERIGRYKDPIVAANAANHARAGFGLPILNTNVPYIPKEEVNKQNIRQNLKRMAEFVK